MPILDQGEIMNAIACVNWQALRSSLKGTTTAKKLETLARYHDMSQLCCTPMQQDIQVINYLNALARGGQIAPLEEHMRMKETIGATMRKWEENIVILKG
jgi:hypothetical protein